jgi:lactoylglutathione lyase
MSGRGRSTPEFSNVRLLVRDFAVSWRFYRDVVGLIPAKGHGRPPYGEFVWGERALVGMFEQRSMADALDLEISRRSKAAVGPAALVLEVPDVDAMATRLRRRGVRLLRGPTDRKEWGLRTIHLSDPDGNVIEFYSRLRTR